jgi:hypothetical protein
VGIRKGEFNIQTDWHNMNRDFTFLVVIVSSLIVGCSSGANVSVPADSSAAVSPASAAANNAAPGGGTDLNAKSSTPLPGAGRAELHYEPAPEDSQIAQATNSSGQFYEVRIFKRNPQLLKVESVSTDQKNRALTIVLRTAQVFNVTTDRIPNLKLATANQLLELAGVQPVKATPAPKGTAALAPKITTQQAD